MSTNDDKENKEAAKQGQDEEEASGSTGGVNVEYIRKYIATKLGFYQEDNAEDKEKILSEFTVDGIVEYMKSDKCKNIITMAGAGISTSAGIPDFRSPVHGLYHNLQKYNLPHPQAVFELEFFHENPQPFFELARELYPGTFKPTLCHYFIKLLEIKGLLLRHYTQNIDTLERVAHISEEKLVEAHGTFHTGHCLECRKEYTQEWMKEKIFANDVPICDDCPGVVKPDIVFFGEQLPDKFYKCIPKDFKNCDLLIILGSSLVVQPFASLVDRVPDTCPRFLINREKAGQRTGLMAMMGMGGGMEFDNDRNIRDVCWLGDCDDGCLLLAEKMGWKEDLLKLFNNDPCEEEHKLKDRKREQPKEPRTKTADSAKGSSTKSTSADTGNKL